VGDELRDLQSCRRCIIDSSASLHFEQIQIDRFAHLKIAERRWMNSIAAIVSNVEKVGIRCAAYDAVEIDDGIKASPPRIQALTSLRTFVFAALNRRGFAADRTIWLNCTENSE
jgi:hypothetical protein